MKNKNCSVLTLTLVFATACSSLSHKKDEAALQNVKKVAVVAFMADEPASAGIGFSLNSHQLGAEAGGSLIPQHSESVDQMLAALEESFAKKMRWQVLDTKRMISNPGYAQAYHQTMDGWQSKGPPNRGLNRYLVEKVMDYDCTRILDRPGRDKLITDLGVDAIISSNVRVYNAGNSVMGLGSRHPQANLSFAMYIKGRDEPVWFEGRVAGDESKESVGSTHFTDEEKTAKLSLASAKTAFERIGSEEK